MTLQRKFSWIAAAVAVTASAALMVGGAWVRADVSTPPLAQITPQQQAAIDSANSLSSAFRTIANAMLPTVVAIENRPAVAKRIERSPQPSQDPFRGRNPFKGTPLEEMMKDFSFRMPEGGMPEGGMPGMPFEGPSPSRGIGSGVIIDPSGIILTNHHVVTGGGEVIVRTQDGREFVATDVWTDPKTDLAVVKITGSDHLVAAPLGNSDDASIGDWVLALGQPFGLESTVTAGIISAKHRGIGIADRENFLQTDAAINPGNSGGPLVNLRGEVIGINTAIHSRSGGSEGIGFAIPSNLARWVSRQLMDGGKVRRAYLGVGIQAVDQTLAKQLDVQPRAGVVVTDVMDNTPAAQAGLQPGDIIVSIDGRSVATPQALQLAVEQSPIGDEIALEVMRDGKRVELAFRAAEQPGELTGPIPSSRPSPEAKPVEAFGLEVAELDSDLARRLGVQASQGVLITSVRDGSRAAEAGLSPAMVIVEVNRKKVNSVAEFQAAIEEASNQGDDGLLMLVRTNSGSRFIVVR